MIKVKNGNRKGVHNDKKSELINEPLWVVAQHIRNIYLNEENRKGDCQKGEYLIDFIETFEKRVSEYQKAGVLNKEKKETNFTTDAAF